MENTQPTGYSITISNNAHLRHVITRTNPISLMPILLPPAPNGTRDVSLTEDDQTIGDPATLRHLTISGKAGEVVVPPGTYGRFSASGHTAFVLGVEGTTVPTVYNLEELSLLGGSELRVVGPVKLTVKTNVTLVGSSLGAPDDPTRLVLQVAQGTVSVSGNAVLYGIIRNPQGMVSIPGNGRIRGTVTCDRLLIDGNGILQITYSDVAPPPVNRPPTVDAGPDQTITLPTDTVSLNGIATDDGLPVTSTLATSWTRISGPGSVTFADPNNPSYLSHIHRAGHVHSASDSKRFPAQCFRRDVCRGHTAQSASGSQCRSRSNYRASQHRDDGRRRNRRRLTARLDGHQDLECG